MTSDRTADWLSQQGMVPPERETVVTDAGGARHLTLMNLVFRDDYGLAHKTSVAAAPCPADSPEAPLALEFDSHSNAFPEDFYHRIGVTRAAFRARLRAAFCRVRVLRRDPAGGETLVAEAMVRGEQSVDLPFDLRAGGSRCLVRIDASADLTLSAAAWTTPAPADHRPIGVSITTYNKEAALRANLQGITDSAPARDGLLEVLVVNNGRPLDPLPETVTLVECDNIGGTGGFITAYNHFQERQFGHFLIMDDDILIAPDFIERVFAISCLARGVHIGTIAEVQNSPDRLIKEQGARVSRSEFLGLDLHNRDLLLDGPGLPRLYPVHSAEYCGWWGLLVDLSAPQQLPPRYFFIKRDDITFGVDSAAQGCETLVFPNLHVTHSEIGALTYFYYDVRNELILRASHAPDMVLDPWQLRLVANWCLVTLQTDLQRMLNLALRDFLRGAAYLQALDPGERLAQLRRIATAPVARPEGAPALAAGPGAEPGRAIHFLLPGSYRHDPDPPVIEGDPVALIGRRSAYFAAVAGSDTVYPRRRRLSALVHYARALLLLRSLRRRYPALQKDYARR